MATLKLFLNNMHITGRYFYKSKWNKKLG